jgi:hypothetical protein
MQGAMPLWLHHLLGLAGAEVGIVGLGERGRHVLAFAEFRGQRRIDALDHLVRIDASVPAT